MSPDLAPAPGILRGFFKRHSWILAQANFLLRDGRLQLDTAENSPTLGIALDDAERRVPWRGLRCEVLLRVDLEEPNRSAERRRRTTHACIDLFPIGEPQHKTHDSRLRYSKDDLLVLPEVGDQKAEGPRDVYVTALTIRAESLIANAKRSLTAPCRKRPIRGREDCRRTASDECAGRRTRSRYANGENDEDENPLHDHNLLRRDYGFCPVAVQSWVRRSGDIAAHWPR